MEPQDPPKSVTALEKHACAACGAQAEWRPAKQALICSYCGTEAPYEIDADTGEVREIDLVTTLREIPDELRGWRAQKRSVRCRSCHAISVFDPERVGQNCEFCGSPELVDYDEVRPPLRPQSILPFKIDRTRVREAMRRWFGSKWLAPSRFKKRAMIDTVHGLYIPYWTFDAQTICPWTAESGHYYYTEQTFRDSQGRMQVRRKRRVRWSHSSGQIEHFFDDTPISGTRGIDAGLLRSVEPFPNNDLVPYDTAYLSGFVVEHYQVVLIDAAQSARQTMGKQLHELCGRQVPGDTYRNLRIDPKYSGQTFKHILVPVWLLAYNYGSKVFQVVVNGHTGKISGSYPKSFWKIFMLFALAAIVVAGLVIATR